MGSLAVATIRPRREKLVERATPASSDSVDLSRTEFLIPSHTGKIFDAISPPAGHILQHGMSRLIPPLSFMVLIGVGFAGGPSDYHTNSDGARDLYVHSAFAHGLRHGYEEGFHAADLDIHTGAPRKRTNDLSRVPKTIGYHRGYGDKKSFRRGYEYGYVAGYEDSIAFRKFHDPAVAVDVVAITTTPNRFDEGVASGYGTVFHSNAADVTCVNKAASYCAGFEAGVAMARSERHEASAGEVATGRAPKR